MKMEDILNAIRELASSQGFYGRLLRDLTELKENDLESYNSIKEELESQKFADTLDLIIYLESQRQYSKLYDIIKLRKEGKDANEVVDIINEMVPKVRSQFTIDTLNYLHKGGRCSGASKLFGTLLNIKPIIKVVDNAMVVAKRPIGYQRAIRALIDEAISQKRKISFKC